MCHRDLYDIHKENEKYTFLFWKIFCLNSNIVLQLSWDEKYTLIVKMTGLKLIDSIKNTVNQIKGTV